MKKIALIDYDMSKTGGIEKVVESLANTLFKSYEVHVISLQYINDRTPYMFEDQVKFISLNDKSKKLNQLPFFIFKKLRRYLVHNNIEVALLMGYYPAFGSLFVQKSVKTKFVFCDHGALMNQINDKKAMIVRFLMSWISEKTVVLTEQTQKDYLRLFHLPEKKVLCIPNWIEDSFIKNAKEYDLESKRLISVGRFGKEKGYDMAIEVARIVFAKYPDWKWDFYGDGETFSFIQEKVKEYGLEEQVILHGSVSDTSRLYSNHALLVLPSYREGLPLVLLEAKANHLPCVSFDVLTGPREVIRDGENGFLIPMYDILAMAEKICQLIEDRELRKKFAENTVLDMEKFQKDKIEKQWVQMIETK